MDVFLGPRDEEGRGGSGKTKRAGEGSPAQRAHGWELRVWAHIPSNTGPAGRAGNVQSLGPPGDTRTSRGSGGAWGRTAHGAGSH